MPTPYDYNLILALPTGSRSARFTILNHRDRVSRSVTKHQKYDTASDSDEDGEDVLLEGGEMDMLTIWPPQLQKVSKVKRDDWLMCFERLKTATRSRLVLFAHGDATTTRVADRTGHRMAKLLTDRLGLQKVTRISLLSCFAGGDSSDAVPGAWYCQIRNVKCFAQEFHEFLGRKRGVYTEVTARTGTMKADADNNGRRLVWFPDEPLAEPGSGNGKWKHKAPGSKLLWYWECGEQKVKAVY